MVSNFWNDPEEDMERTAIDHYLDDLTAHSILLHYLELIKSGVISKEALMGIMRYDLQEHYDVNMDNEGNVDYLEREVDERMNDIAFNMGEGLRQVQS